MRKFGTQGPVNPQQHYVVPRTEELAEFIKRIKEGRYVVIFAPRQTGKTTFFYAAMDILAAEEPIYFTIHLDFEPYKNFTPADFYASLTEDVREEIENVYHKRGEEPSETLRDFLEHMTFTNIVETKLWRGEQRYTQGKQQLAAYLATEGVTEGYYVVFDHRDNPEPRIETESIHGLMIRSYVIPVMQEQPSEEAHR